jgi:hypothetical protein
MKLDAVWIGVLATPTMFLLQSLIPDPSIWQLIGTVFVSVQLSRAAWTY